MGHEYAPASVEEGRQGGEERQARWTSSVGSFFASDGNLRDLPGRLPEAAAPTWSTSARAARRAEYLARPAR